MDTATDKCCKALKEMTEIQCSDGNWNYDPYMHGMANGMILALSLFQAKDPVFLDPPKVWLRDKKQKQDPTTQGDVLVRATGILDIDGDMIYEGDIVCYPHLDENERRVVVFVGDGDDMDWAADQFDGTADSWLDNTCKKIATNK